MAAVLFVAAAVVIVVLSAMVALFLDSRRSRAEIDLPGPRGLPFVGNAFQLDRRRPWETMGAWRRTYGDAYLIKLFSQPVVVLCGPTTIREALVDRGRDFAGRPRPFYRAGFMADHYQDVVSGSPGPVWNALRRAVQRAMRVADPSGNIGGAGRWTEHLTGLIVDELCDELDENAGLPFDPRPSVYHAVMNMTCMMLIGDRFRRDDEELTMYKRLERLVTTSMSVGGRGSELDLFPWLRHFGNATYRKLVEAKQLRNILYDRICERVGSIGGGATQQRGVVHALFDEMADEYRRKTSGVTENHLKLAIVNLLVGGAAATTGYIYAAIGVLAHHPEVQTRIRAEVDAVVACGGQCGQNKPDDSIRRRRSVTLDDKPLLPYTSAAIIELLRYASLSPILIPHRTMSDTIIGKTKIPAGVQVFLHVRAVHHDPEFWPDPFRFQPERFLERSDKDASALPQHSTSRVTSTPDTKWRLIPPDDERRRRVMSFGAGPRACPGEAVAMTRLFLTVTNLVRRFFIEPETETLCNVDSESDEMMSRRQASCDPRTYDPGLVLSPKDFKVKFIPR